jgi:hypothetical protein
MGFLDERLLVTLGARRQGLEIKGYNNVTGNRTSHYNRYETTPVAGILYQLNDELSVYANYIEGLTKGDTAPAESGGQQVLNSGTSLAPYVAKQTEIGLKYDGGNLGGSIAVFSTERPFGIVENQVFREGGEQRNRGIELSVFGEPAYGTRLLGGLTLLDAEQKKTLNGVNDGNDAIGVPKAQANIGDVRMIYAFDDNVTVTEQERVLEEAERILLASREELGLRDVVVRMGGWMGRPQIRCFLVPPDDRKLTREGVIAALQERVPRVPGAKWSLTWDTSDGVGGIDLMIAGRQSAQLDALLPAVIERLERLPGVTSVVRRNDASSSRELQLRPDREIAATLGLPVGAVGAFVDLALRGREVGQLVGGDEPVKIYASAGAAAATSPAALNALPLPTLSGMVPLGSVTKGQVASGIGSIERVNGRTVAQLVVRTSREDIDALGKEMDRALATFPWPEGYGPEKGSRLTGIASNNSDLFMAFLLATVFIFLLMGFLFESFVLPLAILFSVPFAFTGAIWTLYLTGTPFDVMAGIGLVILVGVVVNNGIVLIDLVAELRRGGLTRTEALVAAGRERFRPVVMTALTTIVGLIPMAFGSTAIVGIPYAPLGRSLMGGMLFSTVLTLVVVPVAYSVLDDLRNWFYRLSGLAGDKEAEGAEVSDAAG